MQSKLHGNVVHHGVQVLLLVSMLFLLAIPKSLLILKEVLYTSVSVIVTVFYCQMAHEMIGHVTEKSSSVKFSTHS